MPVAESIPRTVEYVTWTGSNLSDIAALGADTLMSGTSLQVRTGDNRWQDVFPGWTVAMLDGTAVVFGAGAWQRLYRHLR